MSLVALAVAAFLLVVTGLTRAGGAPVRLQVPAEALAAAAGR